MSSTTTLITFRVRAPPSTRTLRLYGSWDNFTRGYPMSKDLQAGSEYWSGCFNFSNIICDGRPSDHMRPRDGGLRMGGTYWYHYKINDEVDFHNVCERATTNCPMMPGQLINILNVPYAFSGNRARNPSTSSTSSERHTMNPDDKFMNPRPAPAKPQTMRVSSSPTHTDFSETDDALSAAKFLRLPRKASLDSFASQSPNGALAGGLRAAFRLRTARSQSPESQEDKMSDSHRRAASAERPSHSRNSSRERVGRPGHGLLLRSASDESVPTLSFEHHRRQRSHSRELSRLRNMAVAEQPRQVEPLILLRSNHQPLRTLTEVASNSNTPIDTSSSEELPIRTEVNLEKRLPTLPNTPSSAYPPSMMGDSPERKRTDLENLESHFSATTIDTEFQSMSVVIQDRSHFSAWTETSSIIVDASIPLPNPRAMEERENSARMEDAQTVPNLPSSVSISSISSSICTTPSTSFLDVDAEFEAAQVSAKLYLPSSQVQYYALPADEYASQITLKAPCDQSFRGQVAKPTQPEIIHSESMQKLLDELSYLSEMIQQ